MLALPLQSFIATLIQLSHQERVQAILVAFLKDPKRAHVQELDDPTNSTQEVDPRVDLAMIDYLRQRDFVGESVMEQIFVGQHPVVA